MGFLAATSDGTRQRRMDLVDITVVAIERDSLAAEHLGNRGTSTDQKPHDNLAGEYAADAAIRHHRCPVLLAPQLRIALRSQR